MINCDHYDQAIDEAIVLQKAIEDHECDHSGCISKADIPTLPAGWCGPWSVDGEAIVDSNGHIIAHVYDYGHRTPEFIADLLNVTYPSKAGE